MDPLPELIEGHGLVLRRWVEEDAPVVEELVNANADHLRGYMPWVAELPLGLARRRSMLAEWASAWEDGGDVYLGTFEHGVPVGACGLHRRIGPTGVEIGYWVDRRHLGRGIARRASAALTDAALARPELDHVEIHHNETNRFSRRIPVELGYREVGVLELERDLAPAETRREIVWRVTRDEWARRDVGVHS